MSRALYGKEEEGKNGQNPVLSRNRGVKEACSVSLIVTMSSSLTTGWLRFDYPI